MIQYIVMFRNKSLIVLNTSRVLLFVDIFYFTR